MKTRVSFLNMTVGAVLAATMALGAVGCLFSGFELTVLRPLLCAAVTLLCALFGALFGRMRRGWIPTAVLSAAGTAALVKFSHLTLGLTAVLDRVTMEYEEAYGWTPTSFFSDPYFVKSFDTTCTWLAALFALWLAFTVVKGVNPLWLVAASVLPVVPCLVATDTPPAGVYVFVWLAASVTLLLAVSGGRVRSAPRFRRTALTAVAAVAAMALLFAMLPPDAEYDQKHEWRDHVLHRFGLHSGSENNDHTAYNRAPVEMIEDAGYPRGTQMVMKILASTETTVYLREQDYNVYDGARWMSEPERHDSPQMGREADWYLSVQTPVSYARKFVPYYPASRVNAEGGNVRNMKREVDYVWKVADLDDDWKAQVEERATDVSYSVPWEYHGEGNYELPILDSGYPFIHYEDDFAMVPPIDGSETVADELTFTVPDGPVWESWIEGRYDAYLALPEATDAWAQTVIAPLVDEGMTFTRRADAIAEYVKNQAEYVEYTFAAPNEGDDYVRWFLEDYRKGCCVHFATATAVLLRAAGVPTRYVTGYARDVKRTNWTAVLETHAHAWVEYYEPLMNRWIRLEATPSVALGLEEETTTESTDQETATTTQPDDETTVTTRPSQPMTGGGVSLPVKEILLTAGAVMTVCLLVAGQRALRLWRRRRRRNNASVNDRARQMWHESERLAKACREQPPKALFVLAQKAAFSRDTLTADELAVFEMYREEAIRRLKAMSFVRRVWHRLVLVLY